MKTLLVLCAGSRMVNNQPLFLLTHPDGKLVAEKVIEGIYPESYDRIIYVILKETEEQYLARKKIFDDLGKKYPIEVVELEHKTSGPAETAYEAIKLANVEGEVAIRDSHSYVNITENMSGNFIAGLDLTSYEKPIDNLRTKSFIVLNEQKQVLDVVEKRFCSDVISGGLYGFKKTSDFVMAYEKLGDSNYPIKKLYISHIISYLIGYSKRVFHSSYINKYEDWATLNSWMRVQKQYATYFLDLDSTCGINVPFQEVFLEVLRKASYGGCRFIAYTANEQFDEKKLLTYMNSQGINTLQVVSGCTVSKVRTIIDNKELLNDIILEG